MKHYFRLSHLSFLSFGRVISRYKFVSIFVEFGGNIETHDAFDFHYGNITRKSSKEIMNRNEVGYKRKVCFFDELCRNGTRMIDIKVCIGWHTFQLKAFRIRYVYNVIVDRVIGKLFVKKIENLFAPLRDEQGITLSHDLCILLDSCKNEFTSHVNDLEDHWLTKLRSSQVQSICVQLVRLNLFEVAMRIHLHARQREGIQRGQLNM
mmetsp:Transcript_21123/g.37906  ORF Transcript_21123/g.37906 Transcript_21123/m.37906 type:complete len:207 (-) Transcript_21123:302-922(-)